jgi:hypothetical protein
MTDRELLEMAAKAAGLKHVCYDRLSYDGNLGLMLVDEVGNHTNAWIPLEDDGEALRLAVKLMEFEPYKSRGYLPCITADAQSTRLAIVRTAAEIGKGIAQKPPSDDLPEDNYYQGEEGLVYW